MSSLSSSKKLERSNDIYVNLSKFSIFISPLSIIRRIISLLKSGKFIDNGGLRGKKREKVESKKIKESRNDNKAEDKCGTNHGRWAGDVKGGYYQDSRSIAFQRLCSFPLLVYARGNSVFCISRRRHRLAPSHYSLEIWPIRFG